MLAEIKVFLFLMVFFAAVIAAVKMLYDALRIRTLSRRKHEFECFRCGKCCTLKVEPTRGDVKRIESAGHSRKDFMDGRFLKRVKGKCFFLERQGKHYACSLYQHRPDVCRAWPFTGVFRGRFLFSRTFSCPGIAKFLGKK